MKGLMLFVVFIFVVIAILTSKDYYDRGYKEGRRYQWNLHEQGMYELMSTFGKKYKTIQDAVDHMEYEKGFECNIWVSNTGEVWMFHKKSDEHPAAAHARMTKEINEKYGKDK